MPDTGPSAEGGPSRSASEAFRSVARAARKHFNGDRRLRRNLPADGRLHFDHALPYICLYRPRPGLLDEGTSSLASATSAYLIAPGDERFRAGTRHLLHAIAEVATERLGGFLIVEIWTRNPAEGEASGSAAQGPPHFVVHAADLPEETATVFRDGLAAIDLAGVTATPTHLSGPWGAEIQRGDDEGQPDPLPGPYDPPERLADVVHRLGIEISPAFRNPASGEVYPRILTLLRRAFVRALERGVFAWAQDHTSVDPPHFHSFGRRHVGRSATGIDRRLASVAVDVDAVLLASPVNADSARQAFFEKGCDEPPIFVYRPLPFDPEAMKRKLFGVPLERVEDPLLEMLFREKQEELDHEISMLCDLGTSRFLYGSLQVYGRPSTELLGTAQDVLAELPAPDPRAGETEDPETPEAAPGAYLDATAFARAARREIDRYRSVEPDFDPHVRVRADVSGLIVSGKTLMVARGCSIPRQRVQALLHHEVGTHLVTRYNGLVQPLRLFGCGLAGYGTLQEGLAVLSEYLVGGLTRSRARVLAARVVAADAAASGGEFMDTFRLLMREHGFEKRGAFTIAMRVHRGGGHTKDHHYLLGLVELLRYLARGDPLDALFVGKVGLSHLDVVQELILRGILRLPVVKPRYTSDLGSMERLGACRNMDVLEVLSQGDTEIDTHAGAQA